MSATKPDTTFELRISSHGGGRVANVPAYTVAPGLVVHRAKYGLPWCKRAPGWSIAHKATGFTVCAGFVFPTRDSAMGAARRVVQACPELDWTIADPKEMSDAVNTAFGTLSKFLNCMGLL
jgi:hypothetical protein